MARFDAPSIDSHIAQRLKEYRQYRGMRELADAAHVTPGQISRYEHGRDRIMLRMRPMRFLIMD